MLRGLYEFVLEALELCVRAVRDEDGDAADRVIAMKETIERQSMALLARQAERLRPGDPDYLQLARTQMSVVDKLTRIYDLSARVARAVLPQLAGIERAAA